MAEIAEQAFLIAIRDDASGTDWFVGDDGPFAHLMNVFGPMQRAVPGAVERGRLEHPRFVQAGATVTVTLRPFSLVQDYEVYLAFRGLKVFRDLPEPGTSTAVDRNIPPVRVAANLVQTYFPRSEWTRAHDWFTFDLDFTEFLAGGVAQAVRTFTVPNNADFLLTNLVSFVTDDEHAGPS